MRKVIFKKENEEPIEMKDCAPLCAFICTGCGRYCVVMGTDPDEVEFGCGPTWEQVDVKEVLEATLLAVEDDE